MCNLVPGKYCTHIYNDADCIFVYQKAISHAKTDSYLSMLLVIETGMGWFLKVEGITGVPTHTNYSSFPPPPSIPSSSTLFFNPLLPPTPFPSPPSLCPLLFLLCSYSTGLRIRRESNKRDPLSYHGNHGGNGCGTSSRDYWNTFLSSKHELYRTTNRQCVFVRLCAFVNCSL